MYDKGIELVFFREKVLEIGVSELLESYISYDVKMLLEDKIILKHPN